MASHRLDAVPGRWIDVEAEHHPALVVPGDGAVRHPQAGIRNVQEDVHGFPRAYEHRVFPYEVRLDDAVPTQDEKTTRAMDVEQVVHRVVGLHLVHESDLDLVADAETPVDRVVLGTGRPVHDDPAHVGRRRLPVHLDHVVFPLDTAGCIVRVPGGVALMPFILHHPIAVSTTPQGHPALGTFSRPGCGDL